MTSFPAKIREHKESKSTESLIVTAGEIGKVLLACGVTEENVAAFQAQCGERFGVGGRSRSCQLDRPWQV